MSSRDILNFLYKFLKIIKFIFSIIIKIIVLIFKFIKALFKGEIREWFLNFAYSKKKKVKKTLKDMKEYDPKKVAAPRVQQKNFAGNVAQKKSKPEKRDIVSKAKESGNKLKELAQNSNKGKDVFIDKKEQSTESFAERSKYNMAKYIYLVNGQDRGRDAWHYVLVDPPKLSVFRAKTQGGSLDVADYGKVLYSGWGKTPPQDIKDKIKAEYLSPEARKREDEFDRKKAEEEAEKKAQEEGIQNNEEKLQEGSQDNMAKNTEQERDLSSLRENINEVLEEEILQDDDNINGESNIDEHDNRKTSNDDKKEVLENKDDQK